MTHFTHGFAMPVDGKESRRFRSPFRKNSPRLGDAYTSEVRTRLRLHESRAVRFVVVLFRLRATRLSPATKHHNRISVEITSPDGSVRRYEMIKTITINVRRTPTVPRHEAAVLYGDDRKFENFLPRFSTIRSWQENRWTNCNVNDDR